MEKVGYTRQSSSKLDSALVCTTFPLRGQGMCQPPYSVLKPLRYKVGGPSEVYASSRAAVFCAGINPLSLKDLLKDCLIDA